MDILGLLLIIMIFAIFYKLYSEYQIQQNTQTQENFLANIQQNFNSVNTNDDNNDDNIEETNIKKSKKNKNALKYLDKMIKIGLKNKTKNDAPIRVSSTVNPYFQEIQFHQDYRDTLNAFTMLCDQKNVFNKSDVPLLTVEKVEPKEVDIFITKFIKEVNKTVKNTVGDIAGQKLNSWQDYMPTVTAEKEDSWQKFNKKLGLPTSIYPNPAKRAPIKLIKIDHIEKFETTDQTKYNVFLIVQKSNVEDQMIIKISFVVDKKDINLDREFFDKTKNSYSTSVIIEEISVVGFLLKEGMGRPQTDREKFYDFDGFSDGRLIPEKEVIRQLNEKKKQIQENYLKSIQ